MATRSTKRAPASEDATSVSTAAPSSDVVDAPVEVLSLEEVAASLPTVSGVSDTDNNNSEAGVIDTANNNSEAGVIDTANNSEAGVIDTDSNVTVTVPLASQIAAVIAPITEDATAIRNELRTASTIEDVSRAACHAALSFIRASGPIAEARRVLSAVTAAGDAKDQTPSLRQSIAIPFALAAALALRNGNAKQALINLDIVKTKTLAAVDEAYPNVPAERGESKKDPRRIGFDKFLINAHSDVRAVIEGCPIHSGKTLISGLPAIEALATGKIRFSSARKDVTAWRASKTNKVETAKKSINDGLVAFLNSRPDLKAEYQDVETFSALADDDTILEGRKYARAWIEKEAEQARKEQERGTLVDTRDRLASILRGYSPEERAAVLAELADALK